MLNKACNEITRVTKKYVIIGVPFKQDIRIGRITCTYCGVISPPWGHFNSFDEKKIKNLFPSLVMQQSSFIGVEKSKTNPISSFLMDLSGNPYGVFVSEIGRASCRERV